MDLLNNAFSGLLTACTMVNYGEPLASKSEGDLKCIPLNMSTLVNTNSNPL